MLSTKFKNIFSIVFFITAFASISLLIQTNTLAFTCLTPENIFIASYEQGSFLDGFTIKHEYTENMSCVTRLVVSESVDYLQSTFTIASQKLNKPVSTGIYQLSGRCGTDKEGNDMCTEATTLEQLSNNPSELARHKSEWRIREQQELRSVATEKWSVVAIMVAVVALAILWPWILVRVRPSLLRRLSLVLIAAIILQALIALVILPILSSIWSYDLLQLTVSVSFIILGLSILSEIIFIIVKKIRSKNVAN